jgi:hypothetical protein
MEQKAPSLPFFMPALEQKESTTEQKGSAMTLFAWMMVIKESSIEQKGPSLHVKGPSLEQKESTVGTKGKPATGICCWVTSAVYTWKIWQGGDRTEHNRL